MMEEQTGSEPRTRGTLTLIFDIHTTKKPLCFRPTIPSLELSRSNVVTIKELDEHLETHLLLPSGHGYFLLLLAVCVEGVQTHNRNPAPHRGSQIIPLVCDQILTHILASYRRPRLKILVEKRTAVLVQHWKCLTRPKELKCIDITKYFPKKLHRDHTHNLCYAIFNSGIKIKHSLRRGIWMHLVSVYHPDMITHDQRELYLARLRRIYDSLKGKWQVNMSSQVRRLRDSIKRDALRTDPGEPFYASNSNSRDEEPAEEDNVQKLVNIILIYTLEHEGVSYTQGMTDLLSPILYVMQREDDAYICFSAMLERIKMNFSLWCEGTLNKIERLRHICEVLDPQLYSYLSNNIQEDAFALFFGMVLIECRREFTFMDSFHLLEVVWSASACLGQDFNATADLLANPNPSPSQWAGFMTYESNDIIQQVFGEMQSPYSAEPLAHTMSATVSMAQQQQFSRDPSLISQLSSQRGSAATHTVEATVHSNTTNLRSPSPKGEVNRDASFSEAYRRPASSFSTPIRRRSYTDPNCERISPPGVGSVRSLAIQAKAMSHSESELYENSVHITGSPKNPTEMSDMSSVSSGAGALQLSCKSTDASSKSTGLPSQNTPDLPSVSSTSGMPSQNVTDLSSVSSTSNSVAPQNTTDWSSSSGKVLQTTAVLERDESGSGSYYTAKGSGKTINNTGEPHSEHSGSIEKDGLSTLTTGTGFATESFPLSYPYSAPSFKNDLPASQHRTELDRPSDTEPPPLRAVDPDDYLESRLSPIVFFDRMEQMATAVPSTPPHSRSRANSDISVIISHLISTEQAAPLISRKSSLNASFTASFPLFICLAIIVQSRSQIVQTRLDFVGLSVLLNAQAGMQNLDHTLRVARHLFKKYQHYQHMYFGMENSHMWLDAFGAGREVRRWDHTSASPDSAESISLHAAQM